jgi:acetylglutamate kinase
MQEAMEKAKVLLESLPYMREFSGQTVVIKYGGSAMTEERLKQSFALNIVLLKYIGINPVIVHGGGPQIGKMLTQLGIDSTFRQGLRVTDPATMDVVEMVLVGKVNKEIVNLINQSGGLAVGLSGKDGRLIDAEKLEMILSRTDAPPEIIDLGRVGEVRRIRTALLDALQQRGFIPIIAPVGVDEEGATYNINADDVTAAVAEALGAKRMILLTDVEGVKSGDALISSLSRREAVQGIEKEEIQGGMIPKVKCCMEAVESGVSKTHIIDGRVENSILLEMFTNAGIGTEIVP